MRVLYFIAYPQRMAGANRSLFELVTNLPSRIEPVVVVAGEGRVADAYDEAGIACIRLAPTGALATFGRKIFATSIAGKAKAAAVDLPRFTARLHRLLREQRIDVVHVNDPRGAALAIPAARLAGVPVVAHLRGELPFGPRIRRLFEVGPDRIITVSEAVRRELSPRGRAKAVTVYNGIRPLPTPTRELPRLEELRSRGIAIVACFASIVPFKGIHHLLRAAAMLKDRGWGERVRFLCVGDMVPEHAPYQRWLRELQASWGVDNFEYTGWQDDPFAYYRYTDVSVLPSVTREELEFDGSRRVVLGNEGFPRTHLEAMQFGVPIVGTRIAGVPEQVEHGRTGLLVEPSDPAGLADALEALLASPARRREMGEQGRRRVNEMFSTDAYVEGVERVYDELGS